MDWKTIEQQLKEPFEPQEIRFRLLGAPRQREGTLMVQVVAYVPAYKVAERLDKVIGPDNWGFRSTPLAFAKGKVSTVKGCMSLFGRAPKEEFGESIRLEPDETPVSEALRRCACLWGVGRHLAALEMWVEVHSQDPKSWAISPEELSRLRAMLPRPANHSDPERETMVVAATGEREAEEVAAAVEEAVLVEEADTEVEAVLTEEAETAEETAAIGEAVIEETEAEEETALIEEAEEAEEEIAVIEEEEAEVDEEEAVIEEIEAEEEIAVIEEEEVETEEIDEEVAIAEEEEVEAEVAAIEEAEESASQETMERADPEKILAIRRLCRDLEEQEPVGLDDMAVASVEAHLSRLTAEWGRRQRLASAGRQQASGSISAHSDSAGVVMVSDEQWREYVQLHTLVRGRVPNDNARLHLKPSTVALMIAALQKELNQRSQPQEAEMTHAGR